MAGRPFRNDLPYLSSVERAIFAQNRKDGKTTFFNTGVCAHCKAAEIPKHDVKRFCSKACATSAGVIDEKADEDDDDHRDVDRRPRE